MNTYHVYYRYGVNSTEIDFISVKAESAVDAAFKAGQRIILRPVEFMTVVDLGVI